MYRIWHVCGLPDVVNLPMWCRDAYPTKKGSTGEMAGGSKLDVLPDIGVVPSIYAEAET